MKERNNKLLPLARQLRKDMTPHERKLWYLFLRNYPAKIKKQQIIGNYIADFYCDSARLVIELDGSQHFSEDGWQQDRIRDADMARLGISVIRFSNRDIDRDFEAVCQEIDLVIQRKLGGE